ncbi:MAG: KamA family radical SAM protein [Chlamydiae bacterium]|nr:KamA family radical SAM protein [Chlamydiota bacterium]
MICLHKSPPLWRLIQKNNFTNIKELCLFLQLSDDDCKKLFQHSKFILNLPLRLAKKIQKGTLNDPIFLQFVPLLEETIPHKDFLQDPVGDVSSKRCSKLLHKYEGRALLISTSACVMHCRYCFRRNYSYENEDKTFDQEVQILENDFSIKEVILSGGDPLSLSNEKLEVLLKKIDTIEHIKTIRFHSRFPIGIPERVDEEFLNILKNLSKQVVFVLHCNHALELDNEVAHSLKQIAKLGIPILNQSVLLKGVNDNLGTMANLLQKLIECGIIPYYLHQLDRAQGTAHFEADEKKGLELIQQLKKTMPGYAIPKFVKEIAGASSKTAIELHSIHCSEA